MVRGGCQVVPGSVVPSCKLGKSSNVPLFSLQVPLPEPSRRGGGACALMILGQLAPVADRSQVKGQNKCGSRRP